MTILIVLAEYIDPSAPKPPPPTRTTMRNKRISRNKEEAEFEARDAKKVEAHKMKLRRKDLKVAKRIEPRVVADKAWDLKEATLMEARVVSNRARNLKAKEMAKTAKEFTARKQLKILAEKRTKYLNAKDMEEARIMADRINEIEGVQNQDNRAMLSSHLQRDPRWDFENFRNQNFLAPATPIFNFHAIPHDTTSQSFVEEEANLNYPGLFESIEMDDAIHARDLVRLRSL